MCTVMANRTYKYCRNASNKSEAFPCCKTKRKEVSDGLMAPLQGWPLFIAELKRVTINLHTVSESERERARRTSTCVWHSSSFDESRDLSASRFIITRSLIRRGCAVSLQHVYVLLFLRSSLSHLLLCDTESNLFISRGTRHTELGIERGNNRMSALRLITQLRLIRKLM